MPFVCKERVLNSCVLSALLYGCESWFSSCTKPLDSLYMSAIKAILGGETDYYEPIVFS